MLYCDDCQFLNPKEAEQDETFRTTGKRKVHNCQKCNQPIFHYREHPRIPRPNWCLDYKKDSYA